MVKWSNWSGRHSANPEALAFPKGPEDAAAIVARTAQSGKSLRVAGSGHSHAPLVPSNGVIVDLSGLSGVIGVNEKEKTATVLAGTKIHALGEPLRLAGLGLFNQGDIDRQAIAGAVSTGTHGTGRSLKNFAAAAKSITVVLASGEVVTVSETQQHDLWQAARLGLGAFGLVTSLELQVREAYRLRDKAWQEDINPLLERTDELARSHRHFEFFWNPQSDEAFAKTIDETSDEPEYPVGEEGDRCGWSHEVFPSHRPHLHTEMEYSVPEENGIACFREIRNLIQKDFPSLQWPVEFRTLAADDVWLSTAFERPTVTLSVHQTIKEDEEPLYRACEEVFLAHQGRPHWGKVHYLDGEQLAAAHPRWQEWWAKRDEVDPNGTFLNEHLRALHPQ